MYGRNIFIGNTDGSKLPDMSHVSAVAIAMIEVNQEKAYRKLNVPDQIIGKDLNRLKLMTPS